MLAIVQGRQIDAIDPQRHVIFAPRDVGVFSFTLLWSLYYRLSIRPNTRRIVYLRSDDTLDPTTLLLPKSQWVKQILGKTISYRSPQKTWILTSDDYTVSDTYFARSELWYTHLNFLTTLWDVEVCPIVFGENENLLWYQSLIHSFFQDPDVICIISDPLLFELEQSYQWPQIMTLKKSLYGWFDGFCEYCDMTQHTPHIMKVEEAERKDDTVLYQGILVA